MEILNVNELIHHVKVFIVVQEPFLKLNSKISVSDAYKIY